MTHVCADHQPSREPGDQADETAGDEVGEPTVSERDASILSDAPNIISSEHLADGQTSDCDTLPSVGSSNLRSSTPARVVLLAVVIALSLVVCAVAIATGKVNATTIQSLASGGGYVAMGVYVALVVTAQLLWMPRLWGLLAAGVLFGPVVGGIMSLIADTISAAICFGIARYAAKDWTASMLARKPKADTVVKILAQKKGALTIALLRASPVAHYTLVSYSAGASGMKIGSFFIGNTLGLLPGAVLYPLVGDSITRPTNPVFIVSTGILVVFLIVTIVVGKKAFQR